MTQFYQVRTINLSIYLLMLVLGGFAFARVALAQQFLAPIEDVPALLIDLPPEPRPWDEDVDALIAAIMAEDGHAIVGFKAPQSERVVQAEGLRAAIPASVIISALEILQNDGIEIIQRYSFGAAAVRMNPEKARMLRNHPLVDYVEPQQHYQLSGVPLETRQVLATTLPLSQVTPWGITLVRAPETWSTTGGAGAKVQVIDTGINPHVDLPSVPSGNCGGQYSGCSDGPIYHGTHVAGSALARNNTTGVVGVAPAVANNDVYSWAACNPSTGFCSTTQIAAGIDAGKWAGVGIISMSLGGGFDSGISNAVASAWQEDIVLVAAAGNLRSNQSGGSVVYPAGYSQVIGVSGVKEDGLFASTSPCADGIGGSWKSNHGPHVDLAGPFWALSTVGSSGYENENQGWCGTSMATPHVSGTAALVRAQNPSWTNQQVRDQLFATAYHPIGGGKDQFYGYGIVSAAAAVGVISRPAAPTNFAITNKNDIWNHPHLQWTASATSGVTYRVFHSTSGGQQWDMIGTTSSTSYTDGEVQITTMQDAEDQHVYHVRAIKDGLESDPSNIDWVWGKDSGIGKTAMVPQTPMPRKFELRANYPNPFNPSTEIRFALPEASEVTLQVLDLLGREVAQVVAGSLSAGYHNATVDASVWPSGIYLYRIEAVGAESGARFVDTRRMTLIK